MSSPESCERRAPFLQTNLQADSELILRVFIWPAFIGWMWRVTVLLLKSGDANFGLLFPPTSLSPLSLSPTVVLIPLLRLLFPPACLSVLSVCLSYPPALCCCCWRQVPGAGKQQPPDPAGDQGRRGRLPLRGQRGGARRNWFCGHRRGG